MLNNAISWGRGDLPARCVISSGRSVGRATDGDLKFVYPNREGRGRRDLLSGTHSHCAEGLQATRI